MIGQNTGLIWNEDGRMKTIIGHNIYRAFCVMGVLAFATTAQAASFDCAKAGTKVEHMICDNPDISKLDENLAKSYKSALQDNSKAEAVRQVQKQWMKARNKCANALCVKQTYEKRLTALTLINSSGDAETAKQEINSDSRNGQQYHFKLTRGKGIPVCDAYLKRLNVTKYKAPPFCGRPENDVIPGFVKLNRVQLTPNDVRDLYPIVWSFMLNGNRGSLAWWEDITNQQQITQNSQFKLSASSAKTLEAEWNRGGWAKIWRYDPQVDIDNDGTLDNVEIWHGSALPHGVGGRACGADMSDQFPGDPPLHQPQVAFVIAGNNDRLDVLKTVKIFAHPMGGYELSEIGGKKKMSSEFRPIGDSIGVFKYQGLYYFDTFFNSWGDTENKRRNDKQIGDTLAVFLHKDGKTNQVCEYLMTDKNKGDIK